MQLLFVLMLANDECNHDYGIAKTVMNSLCRRPWDVDRDGFVMGEGAGVFVFESLEHASKRGAKIYGEYLGGAVTCDAHHMTDPRADGLGVSTCIQLALKDAAIEKEQVNYINAHATR